MKSIYKIIMLVILLLLTTGLSLFLKQDKVIGDREAQQDDPLELLWTKNSTINIDLRLTSLTMALVLFISVMATTQVFAKWEDVLL